MGGFVFTDKHGWSRLLWRILTLEKKKTINIITRIVYLFSGEKSIAKPYKYNN